MDGTRALAAATPAAARPRWRKWLSPLSGVLLLLATLHYVQPAALLARLTRLRVEYVGLGAVLVLPQLVCLALRWRQAARLIGLRLARRRAVREYALSMLLNQLLPFGVAGDAVRVARHARTGERGVAPALQGVLVERGLGQAVVVGWALAALPLWLGRAGAWASAAALSATLLAGYALLRSAKRGLPAWLGRLTPLVNALAALLSSPRLLAWQLGLSSLVLLGIVAQLYCALWSLGLSLPLRAAAQVFPFMLLAMTLPLSIAGFGPREAATVQLYAALQLSPADGAAFAMAYGAELLCAALVCLGLVLWIRPTPAGAA